MTEATRRVWSSVQMGFMFDETLANNLTYWRNAVMKQDIDCALIVDGTEGAGKSVFAMQVAAFLDVEQHIDLDKQVCYYPEQFKEAVMTLPKFKAIVWDEARRGGNRRRAMTQVNIEMMDLFAECRQHNLFLIVVLPSFYDLDFSLSVWRSRCLLHVWYKMDAERPDKPLERGFFRFFNEIGKRELYTNPYYRKRYEYPYLKNLSFDGRFLNHYVVNEEEYRKRKREAEEVYRRKDQEQSYGGAEELNEVWRWRVGRAYRMIVEQGLLLRGGAQVFAEGLSVDYTTLKNWVDFELLHKDGPPSLTRRREDDEGDREEGAGDAAGGETAGGGAPDALLPGTSNRHRARGRFEKDVDGRGVRPVFRRGFRSGKAE